MAGRDLTEAEKTILESMIDSAGLVAVLHSLSETCHEKAEHIRASYGMEARQLSRAWATACGVIGVAACHDDMTRIGEP